MPNPRRRGERDAAGDDNVCRRLPSAPYPDSKDSTAPFSRKPRVAELYAKALGILRKDPYNKSRRYPIKKLRDVKQDDGQYRIRLQRFRIRYDIYGTEVLLQYCGLRREDTYE